eukprot:gene14190-30202_t
MEYTEISRYLIISNISKEMNVKAICITAAAHGFSVLIVGRTSDLSFLENYATMGISIQRFSTLAECKAFITTKGIELVGIEIMKDAVSILNDPFQKAIAFMPGNEGTGLSLKQKELCDRFVYIPQYGSGTASLNVNVATSLVLHRYQQWYTANDNDDEIKSPPHSNEIYVDVDVDVHLQDTNENQEQE